MMALAQQGDPRPRGRLRAAGLQRRLQPGPGRRRRRRAPHPHARRPALGRRHQLHAGARRHAGDAAVARAELRGAARTSLTEPRSWRRRRSSRPTTSAASTAREMDGETTYLVGRAFARVLADLRGKPPAELRVGLGRDMRLQAPEMARPAARRARRRGRRRARRRDGRHRDALFPRRLARARRRRDGHRLAQPEGLHRREARPRGRAGALRRRRDRRRSATSSPAGLRDAAGRRPASRRRRLRRLPRARALVRSTRARSSR